MIDVQPYIDKLEELRHKICYKIDGYIWIDYDSIPQMSPEKILQLFKETGFIFIRSDHPYTLPVSIK